MGRKISYQKKDADTGICRNLHPLALIVEKPGRRRGSVSYGFRIKINDTAVVGIDNIGGTVGGVAFSKGAVAQMDVAVKKKIRVVSVDRPVEGLKALVGQISAVVDPGCRGVGQ